MLKKFKFKNVTVLKWLLQTYSAHIWEEFKFYRVSWVLWLEHCSKTTVMQYGKQVMSTTENSIELGQKSKRVFSSVLNETTSKVHTHSVCIWKLRVMEEKTGNKGTKSTQLAWFIFNYLESFLSQDPKLNRFLDFKNLQTLNRACYKSPCGIWKWGLGKEYKPELKLK